MCLQASVSVCAIARRANPSGGKNAKKRAAVAVAMKLAVLLHRLWVSGEVYDPLHDPLHNAHRRTDVAA